MFIDNKLIVRLVLFFWWLLTRLTLSRSLVMDTSNIGKRMLKIRQEAKLSQTKFAKFTRVARSYLGAVEIGSKPPSFNFIMSVLDVTKVSANWLLLGEGAMYLQTKEKHQETKGISDDRARYGSNENRDTFCSDIEVPVDLKKGWESLSDKQKNELIERVKEMKEYNTMRRIIDNLSSGLKTL
jgi:transcriptional regulator with XRE-family HTH domain